MKHWILLTKEHIETVWIVPEGDHQTYEIAPDDNLKQGDEVYLAIGLNLQGLKEVRGLWASDAEGAEFWLSIITELKQRGRRDILVACVDGLKGFQEAIETAFPQTQVQLCMVHLMRRSLC